MGGDTLFAIAWRYGMDYRKLASINGIGSPYVIYPGQELKLSGAARSKTSSATKPKASSASATSRKTQPVNKASSAPVKKKPSSPTSVAVAPGDWQWPTNGKVVRKFAAAVHKGIDIDGKAGDAVRATASGKVVYAGSGIVGYGNLLIVKHDDVYLSAYGHNRQLLVGEGEWVKVGQRIAEKGSSATNTVKLHFEIRREGKPVDPQKLLPAR